MSGGVMDRRRARRRGGFTLIEVAVAVMIVGILAGVAVPAIQYAILKADAAHIVGDARTIRLAAYDYLSDNGVFPPTAGAGSVPSELVDILPDGFEFTYKDVRYHWQVLSFPDRNNYWQSRSVGLLFIYYNLRPDLAEPMFSHYTSDTSWSPQSFFFIYRG